MTYIASRSAAIARLIRMAESCPASGVASANATYREPMASKPMDRPRMFGALIPDDVRPEGTPQTRDLERVGFYVPAYMGPLSEFERMSQMPNLQVVQLLTAGFESAIPYVPVGVTLCNAAGVHDASTAELAVGLILASLRGIDDFARAMQAGSWRSGRREALADKRIVVVGAGGVGRAIGRRLEPFEVDVVLVGRAARPGVHGVDELAALLPAADIVVVAVPLSTETVGLVDDAFLSRMPDGSLLVNVARGPVVDTVALVAHAATGRVRAALDVTDPEPLPPEHPLWRTPGVLVSPHVGGNTTAFLPRARLLVAEQLRRFEAGQPLMSVVSG
jgi:phosphoglycerate dehydrogenase-like enzyme